MIADLARDEHRLAEAIAHAERETSVERLYQRARALRDHTDPMEVRYPTYSDALLLACELSQWTGEDRACRWCASPLAGRRTRWCSDYCSNEAAANHIWTVARHRALRYAVAARWPGDEYDVEAEREIDWRRNRMVVCLRCGGAVCGNKTIQVHHTGANAESYKVGCQHHVDRLEPLGLVCHVETHKQLRRASAEQLALGVAA